MKKEFPYLLFCVPCHMYEGRQMYSLDYKKFRNFCMYLRNYKRFKDIYDMCLGKDLMYDLALKHTLEIYFEEYPEDEKRCIDNILFM